MSSKKINDIDFFDRIERLHDSYIQVQTCKNFLADAPSELRKQVGKIQDITNPDSDNNHIFHSLKKVISESHATILIECYTISEQMLKNTKYQILTFDETVDSDIQRFLQFKINPEKFSPNPQVKEISNFFKRYGGNKLFISDAEIYDSMIKKRHRYAHQGICDFDLINLPKIIEFLKYLEFEYRMFVQKNCWIEFFREFNSIDNLGGNMQAKEHNYQSKKKYLQNLVPKLMPLIHEEPNIVTNCLEPVLAMITGTSSYTEISTEVSVKKKQLKNYLGMY